LENNKEFPIVSTFARCNVVKADGDFLKYGDVCLGRGLKNGIIPATIYLGKLKSYSGEPIFLFNNRGVKATKRADLVGGWDLLATVRFVDNTIAKTADGREFRARSVIDYNPFTEELVMDYRAWEVVDDKYVPFRAFEATLGCE
jgi:hypothetical protein